jgi:hypothetical protein
MGVQCCTLKTDSMLIAGRIKKECMARDESLERYLAVICRMENHFKGFIVEHIERAMNTEVDEMAKAAVRKAVLPPDVFFQLIEDPSVKTVEPEPRMLNIVQGEDWQVPIVAYLHHHYEPDNSTELTKIRQRAKAYQIIGDELHKTSVLRPLLRYLSKDEGKEILIQTYSGVCGGHVGARALAAKVFRQGSYWPSIIDDSSNLVKTCHACPMFSLNTQTLSQLSKLITPLWPLQRWGIDV